MATGYVHTIYKGSSWLNEIEGGSELPDRYATKEGAQAAGRLRAIERQTEHVIHNQNGTIAERNSYGKDPAGSPG